MVSESNFIHFISAVVCVSLLSLIKTTTGGKVLGT